MDKDGKFGKWLTLIYAIEKQDEYWHTPTQWEFLDLHVFYESKSYQSCTTAKERLVK